MIIIKAIFIKYINAIIFHFLPEGFLIFALLLTLYAEIIFISVKSILLITSKIAIMVTSGKSYCLSHLLALA